MPRNGRIFRLAAVLCIIVRSDSANIRFRLPQLTGHPQCVISLYYLRTRKPREAILVKTQVSADGLRLQTAAHTEKSGSVSLLVPAITRAVTTTAHKSIATRPTGVIENYRRNANATLVMLCKDSELEGVISSITQLESRFNWDHGYPWTLLNNEPFSEEFQR